MDPPFNNIPTNILTIRLFIWPSSFLVPEKKTEREFRFKDFILLWLAKDVFLVLKIWWALDFT